MGISNNYISEIKKILKNARQKAYTAVNSAMVAARAFATTSLSKSSPLSDFIPVSGVISFV